MNINIKKTDLDIKEISGEQLQNISGGCITCCILGSLFSGCMSVYKARRQLQNIHHQEDIRNQQFDIALQQFNNNINNANHQPQNNPPHVEIPMPEGGGDIDLNNLN